jgi:hypothetical protein
VHGINKGGTAETTFRPFYKDRRVVFFILKEGLEGYEKTVGGCKDWEQFTHERLRDNF